MKSHDDLHKLWYVMLKEKNKLKSDYLMTLQLKGSYFGYNDMSKIQLSMARLLTVVNERKKLRTEYRAYLEDNYITEQKALELERLDKTRETENEKRRAQGLKPLVSESEIYERSKAVATRALKRAAVVEEQLLRRFR